MNETDKLIEEQKKTLPPDLVKAIDAVPWKALVQDIGKANMLDTEQIVSFERETMFILYAFENPNDYVANIIREVGVSQDVAETLAESVADKIFDPILNKSGGGTTPPGAPANLPMVEPGETAHTVPHVEQSAPAKPSIPPVPPSQPGTPTPPPTPTQTPAPQGRAESSSEISPETKPKVSLPDYRYPEGADPYREPLK